MILAYWENTIMRYYYIRILQYGFDYYYSHQLLAQNYFAEAINFSST
jgi:hypothetical protein